jgi:hypothetical protein
LQETKIGLVDMAFVRKFASRRFDKFDFVPSNGASGGIIVLWNSAQFSGVILDNLQFGLTIELTSQLNGASWRLTTVYGPCREPKIRFYSVVALL